VLDEADDDRVEAAAGTIVQIPDHVLVVELAISDHAVSPTTRNGRPLWSARRRWSRLMRSGNSTGMDDFAGRAAGLKSCATGDRNASAAMAPARRDPFVTAAQYMRESSGGRLRKVSERSCPMNHHLRRPASIVAGLALVALASIVLGAQATLAGAYTRPSPSPT
jgi:hypothetical protein